MDRGEFIDKIIDKAWLNHDVSIDGEKSSKSQRNLTNRIIIGGISAKMSGLLVLGCPIPFDNYPVNRIATDVVLVTASDESASDRAEDKADVRSVIKGANETLAFTTDDSAKIIVKRITEAKIQPNYIDNRNGELCYTEQELYDFVEDRKQNDSLGDDVQIMVVLPDNNTTCNSNAAAYTWPQLGASVYNDLTPHYVTHEFGHKKAMGGLPHAQDLECHWIQSANSYLHAGTIQEAMSLELCDFPRTEDNQIAEYHSQNSIMGDGHTFMAPELHRINPERFPITTLGEPNSPFYGTYPLSLQRDGIIGVEIPLPDDYTLNQLDGLRDNERFTSLFFGVEYAEQDMVEETPTIADPHARQKVVAYAVSYERTLQIDESLYTFVGSLENPQDIPPEDQEQHSQVFWEDSQLGPNGIMAAWGRDAETGTAYVKIMPLDPESSPEYQEYVDDIKQERARRFEPSLS